MKNYRIALTPLSPLHIGCGEVYEPTNYVVDRAKSLLYAFDPTSIKISDSARSEMRKAAFTGKFEEMLSFFSRHLEDFRPWASAILPMDAGSLSGYLKMLNPKGNQKGTEFAIERTTYRQLLQGSCAYIPGSGLKGVTKTALADHLNADRRIDAKDINQVLFKGDFDKSPFRFLKFSDLQAPDDKVQTRSRCARRYFKSDLGQCGFPGYFETIEPAQYRVFTGEVLLTGDKSRTGVDPAFDSVETMMQELHRYAEKNWNQEIRLYRLADNDWARSVDELLMALAPQIKAGKAALVRIGKNAGAESKTLRGAAQIHIFHPKNPIKKMEIKDCTTTLWFTTQQTSALEADLPFGWALVEVVEDTAANALKVWCEKTAKRVKVDLDAERQSVREARAAVLKFFEKQEQEAAAKRQHDLEVRQAEEKRQAELAAMSSEQRFTEELAAKLEKTPGPINAGHQIYAEVRTAIESALLWGNVEDKKQFALRLRPLMKAKNMFQGNAEKFFKQKLKQLAGEA